MTSGIPVAERIYAARTNMGLTQERAAELLGVSQSTINRYENGKNSPHGAQLRIMALVYGTSAEWLCGETDDPSPKEMLIDLRGEGEDEKELLAYYRELGQMDKDVIRTVAERMAVLSHLYNDREG